MQEQNGIDILNQMQQIGLKSSQYRFKASHIKKHSKSINDYQSNQIHKKSHIYSLQDKKLIYSPRCHSRQSHQNLKINKSPIAIISDNNKTPQKVQISSKILPKKGNKGTQPNDSPDIDQSAQHITFYNNERIDTELSEIILKPVKSEQRFAKLQKVPNSRIRVMTSDGGSQNAEYLLNFRQE